MNGSPIRSFIQKGLRLNAVPVKETISKTLLSGPLPNIQLPPKYTLVSLKSFPSLEPTSVIPVSTSILDVPLRRDILWKAVVYENDNKRVGSSNPPGRSENGYSRHKIRPQKGSGHARVGDANSPTRHGGGRALARNAPNDYTTDLPRKVYSLAMTTALSYQYRNDNLNVIGTDQNSSSLNENDTSILDIIKRDGETRSYKYYTSVFKKFLKENNLEGKRLLFITNNIRENLLKFTQPYKDKVDIIQWQGVEVNDILKAHRIFIELDAFQSLSLEQANNLHLKE